MTYLRNTLSTVRVDRYLVLEAVCFVAIFTVAILVRVINLGSVPQIVMGDEADNLRTAYEIIEGTGPGFIGFDWKPAPIFSMYPLAWTVEVFGDSVADFRMFSVITSLLVLIAFYILGRDTMGAPAVLLGLALLATNQWFLHFSRTAWENGNAALFALGACYATLRALRIHDMSQPSWWRWWAVSGLFVTGGLYGYFTGRFIFLSVILIVLLAIALKQAPWRPSILGLCFAGVLSAILFAPMGNYIIDNWDRFQLRTRAVSVFTVPPHAPGEEPDSGWSLAWDQVAPNFRGLVLQDGREFGVGLWGRYNPIDRGPLSTAAAVIFLAGVACALARWRETYAWFTFLVPLFIAQVFSRGSPDLARAMLFAPFYFLFIAMVFDTLFRNSPSFQWRACAIAVSAALVTWIAVSDVRLYFDWQEDQATQRLRLPGVDSCEFDLFQEYARADARREPVEGRLPLDQAIEQLDCSEVRRSIE